METWKKRYAEVRERWLEYCLSVGEELKKLNQAETTAETPGSGTADVIESFWAAERVINGQHVALDIHIDEQIREEGGYYSLIESPKARSDFARVLASRAAEDKIDTLFWVWDKDVSNKTGIIELVKLLREGLRETELVLVHGDPSDVAQAILSKVRAAGQIKD